ncbi:MAG TPA: hypothetical protein VF187_10005 [Gemmatimonadales bacterium]
MDFMRAWTIAAFGISCALGASTFVARRHSSALSVQLAEARRVERNLRTERTALVASLGQVPPSEPYLVGMDVVADTVVQLDRPRDGVYYLIATTCAACARNLPSLDSLAMGSGGGGVFILALQSNPTVVKEYAHQHRIRVPVLSQLKGFLAAAIPKFVTPLTTIVWDGKITSFIPGDIGTRERSELRSSFEARKIGRH